MSWAEKVIVVAGGSAGLGARIARAFREAGGRVFILGRDTEKLEAVALQSDLEWHAADMTKPAEVAAAVDRIVEQAGRIDVWVNNVGVSARGAVLDTTPEQFRDSFEINFLTAVHGTQAAAKQIQATGGSLVFIGSLASKTAGVHLGAYPAAKFAVAAYAHQIRLELGSAGVHVLLVCPGPLARDDAGSRYAEQLEGLPESAAKPGGGAKLKLLDPDMVARRIVAACQNRSPEIILPAKARLLFAISQLSPNLGDWIIRRSIHRDPDA